MESERGLTEVFVLAGGHQYRGETITKGWRLAEILNNPNSEAFEMHNVQLRGAGQKCAELERDHITLRKRHIEFAVPMGSHEAWSRRNDNRISRPTFESLVVLGGLIVSGQICLSQFPSPVVLLDENSSVSRFIALTNFTIHGSTFAVPFTGGEVVLVNRQFVQAVQLSNKPTEMQPTVTEFSQLIR